MADYYHQNEGTNLNSNTQSTTSLLPETNNMNQEGNSAQYNQQGDTGMTVNEPINQNLTDNNQNQYSGQPYYQKNVTPQNNFQPNYYPPSSNYFQQDYCPVPSDIQPYYYHPPPPQNIVQPNNNVLFDYSKYNNISELSSKYITQPDENTFIIKKRWTNSKVGVALFFVIISFFLAIGILFKIYFLIGFVAFMLSLIIIGLFFFTFSYQITLGENSITIKENRCCRSYNRTYLPGEILNFYVENYDIKYLDNKGNTNSFGSQDYYKAELEYTVYKLNKFIETKMKPS